MSISPRATVFVEFAAGPPQARIGYRVKAGFFLMLMTIGHAVADMAMRKGEKGEKQQTDCRERKISLNADHGVHIP